MEETEIGEVGVDKLSEETHEKAKEEVTRAPWLRWLALSTALFAVTAAFASLEAGRFATEAVLQMNEATLRQAQAGDAWAYFQAKGIKQATRDAEADLLAAMQAPADVVAAARAQATRYASEQEQSKQQATTFERQQRELEQTSHASVESHHTFAYAVTILQVSIGLSAIAALIERKAIWLVALAAGVIGIVFVAVGLMA